MKPIAWLIILGSMVVLQYHSINFWHDMTNSIIGYVVSPVIEIASLMFWHQKERLVAGALSFVVVSASLFHLSKGSVESLAVINNNSVSQDTMQIVEKTLQKADKNGHYVTRQKSLDAITALTKNKAEVKTSKPVVIMNIIVEAVMIFMIFIAQIKSVLLLRDETPKQEPETVVTKEVKQPRNKPVDSSMVDLAKQTLKALREFGLENNLNSETSIRRVLELSAPTFSRLNETYETGIGMTENKMREILSRIENYKL